jgi:hypothetical protein
MPLFVEVAIAYAQRIALPSNFDLKTLSIMMDNLNAYEPSLSCTPAVSEGGELPEQVAKRACVASSVLAMDKGKSYKVITYNDAVDDYSFGGALMSAFEAAVTKVLGGNHALSVIFQQRFGEVEDEVPKFAMYLVHKPTMLTPEDVMYDEVRLPIPLGIGLGSCDIQVDGVDFVETNKQFDRLCRCFGLEATGSAGWKVLMSAGPMSYHYM